MEEKKDDISRRNYGIDMLRIISMIMIPILHVLGHGGILDATEQLSLKYNVAWFMEIAALCSTNVYGIISGYVGYGTSHRLSKLFYIYFQVLFYTVTTTIVFCIFRPNLISIDTLWQSIFNLKYNTYWYFTAYFFLYFFMPYLDKMVEKTDVKEARKLLIYIFIIFSIIPLFMLRDIMYTRIGYSFLWLMVLYIVGACIKKCESEITYSVDKRKYMSIYIICVIATLLIYLLLTGCGQKFDFVSVDKFKNSIIGYTSPTILICAIALVMIFKEMRFGDVIKKAVVFFAPLSFGVYLFHEEPLVRKVFMTGTFERYASYNVLVMAACVLFTAILIWFTGSIFDKIRKKIFKRWEIEKLCIWLEKNINIQNGRN